MPARFAAATVILLLLCGVLPAQQPRDLSSHVFFKHLIGQWEAHGELKGQDNNNVKVKEEWTGKATPEGEFIIEGRRELNDNRQTFRWTITHNATTDSYEAVLTTDGNEAGNLRFEGHVSEVNLTIELKAAIGANGSVTVIDGFAADDKNTIESKIAFLGDNGETTLSGTITHKRVKQN